MLIAIVLASALGTVASQHKGRKFFTEMEREQDRMRALEVEWGQLQLEQSTWASHSRIEKVARERLHMRPPASGHIVAVEQPNAKTEIKESSKDGGKPAPHSVGKKLNEKLSKKPNEKPSDRKQ